MWRTIAAAAAALTLLSACSGGDDEAGEPSDLPAFETTVIEPDQLIVKTDETDPDLLRAVFDQVKAEHTAGDSWYVTLTCASIPSDPPMDMGRLLATGRFANTQLGQAQTGLDSTDHVVFEPTGPQTDCTPVSPAEQAANEAATDQALDDAGIPPKPDQATTDAYIAALEAINPGIVYRGGDTTGDIDTAIDRGRNQCSTIQASPDDRARQIETTNQRFTSPDAPDGWGPETAARILDVVHQHLCPSP